MADICELCLSGLKHWEDEIPEYEGTILCSKCHEEVEKLSDFYGGEKSFEWCCKEVRKIVNKVLDERGIK